jgi:hypothetical protein
MAIGVFGLKQIYRKQYENVEERNLSYWPEGAVYGYYGAGWTGSANVSLITRLDFSNDSISSPGVNLPQARYGAYGLSSNLYAYFNGGIALPSTWVGGVERLNYSNGTVSSPGKNIPARGRGASLSSRHYGYMVAGGPNLSSTFRLDFYNETTEDISKNLAYASDGCFGFADCFNYGYVAGGADTSNISRFDYSSESFTLRSSKITRVLNNAATVSSSGYGYIVGGANPGGYPNTITRLEFSTETVSDPGKNLPAASTRSFRAGTSSISYGYFAGGDNPVINTITRLDFSNETVSEPGKNLPAAHTCTGITGVSGGTSVLPS